MPSWSAFQAWIDRQVGAQTALHHVGAAVEFLGLLALGDLRAGAGGGEERRNACPAGADALGQRALRVELDLQFAGEVLLRERRVLADIGADHLAHLPRLQQHAQTDLVDAGVVRDDRQAFTPLSRIASISAAGMPHRPEPAGHDRHAVAQQARQRRLRIGIDLVDRHPHPRRDGAQTAAYAVKRQG